MITKTFATLQESSSLTMSTHSPSMKAANRPCKHSRTLTGNSLPGFVLLTLKSRSTLG